MNDTTPPATTSRVHFIGAGAVILRSGEKGHEVLLIRRGKPPREGDWSIPGGRQEFGETARETAIREIKEETNLTISDLKLIDVVDVLSTDTASAIETHWTLLDFCAQWKGDAAKAGSDATEVKWVPVEELELYNLWSETTRIISESVYECAEPLGMK